MPSSWDSYYVVFLSAILSLAIPGSLALISFLFFKKKKKRSPLLLETVGTQPNRTILGQRINVRFFIAANAALILIALAIALIPCAITLQTENQEDLLKGLVSIVSLAGFTVLGLLYSVRKGDMGWLSSYHSEALREKKRE